jgi:RNA polymerase sigma factor (TIGR02999 family)
MRIAPEGGKLDGPHRITGLLQAASKGDHEAQSALLPLIDAEMRRIARARLRRLKPGEMMTTTILTHDSYLSLIDVEIPWESRKHFFCVVSKVMRRMIVSEARRQGRVKRGGLLSRIALSEDVASRDRDQLDLLALDEAHEVIMLRFFCGLAIDETARVLKVSPSTVDRYWRFARAWLLRELR